MSVTFVLFLKWFLRMLQSEGQRKCPEILSYLNHYMRSEKRNFLYCLNNLFVLIYFSGKNCELRTSYCESSDDVKNDPPACKNGGTCVSGDTTYACNCTPGFNGNCLP